MTAIELEAIIYPSIVTLLAAIQLITFARKVGKIRMTTSIPYPLMTGDASFERALRAQQNSLEFFPVFMISLWISSLFFNRAIPAVIGLVYLGSRYFYFEGYLVSVKDRLPGFKLGVRCLMLMAGMSVCGFINTLLHMHMGIDLDIKLRHMLSL